MKATLAAWFLAQLAAAGGGVASTQAAPPAVHADQAPSDHHRHLGAFVGVWRTHRTFWPAEGAEPLVSDGTSSYTWIMNERFLREEARGSAMGMAFEGLAIHGYDTFRGQHLVSWIDSLSTAMFSGEGPCEDGGRTIVIEGRFDNAATGQRDLRVRTERRIVSASEHTLEMFAPDGRGRTYKMVRIVYTRLAAR